MSTGGCMGTVALLGGAEFDAIGVNESLMRKLLASAGAGEVIVLPTAAAFEQPGRLVEAAKRWYGLLGVDSTELPVLTRTQAMSSEYADRLAGARYVHLTTGSAAHLRSVMKDTPVWEAVRGVAASAVLVAGASAAAAVCDPLTDPRGGGFTIGLGLISGLAVAHEAETWTEERRVRTRRMVGGFAFAELPSGTALIRRQDAGAAAQWETIGEGVAIIGELPR